MRTTRDWSGMLLVMFVGLWLCGCTSTPTQEELPPEEIRAWFSAPDSLQGDFGDYRSPLRFADGRPVTTAAEWQERRAEIRQAWFDELGAWPDLLPAEAPRILDTVQCDGYRRHSVEVTWLPDVTTRGYLLLPDTVTTPLPAVITVFYEPETAVGLGSKPMRDYALQMVKRGVAALSLGTTETTEARHYALYYPSREASTMQPLNVLAYAAANALESLAQLPYIDGDRIGIAGHSYGGKWAMMASCLYDRFACGVWGDPGIVFDETRGTYINYWAPWYLGYFAPPWEAVPDLWAQDGYLHARGAYPVLKAKGMDLHELHSLMAPRPFLVSGGYSDGVERWRALNHTVEVNRLLGHSHRVALTLRPSHDPDSAANAAAYTFLEWALRAK